MKQKDWVLCLLKTRSCYSSAEKARGRRYDIALKHPENFQKHYCLDIFLSTDSNGWPLHVAFNMDQRGLLLHLPQVTGQHLSWPFLPFWGETLPLLCSEARGSNTQVRQLNPWWWDRWELRDVPSGHRGPQPGHICPPLLPSEAKPSTRPSKGWRVDSGTAGDNGRKRG